MKLRERPLKICMEVGELVAIELAGILIRDSPEAQHLRKPLGDGSFINLNLERFCHAGLKLSVRIAKCIDEKNGDEQDNERGDAEQCCPQHFGGDFLNEYFYRSSALRI